MDDGRVIIALDLDNFYVACERLDNPNLQGKPVGIKQKNILATCSYEARAYGVKKLDNISRAIQVCPDLILVNGEDLTKYRRYSKNIFSLVKSIVGPDTAVEKLGMDEFFCDVSAFVTNHLEKESIESKNDDHERYEGSSVVGTVFLHEKHRFTYRAGDVEGHYVTCEAENGEHNQTCHLDSISERMRLGSCIAQFIRTQIYEQLGFTTSGGIAPSKQLSKLLAALHKPAQQTLWSLSTHSESIRDNTVADGGDQMTPISVFLSSYNLRQIPEFGSHVVQKIADHIRLNKEKEEHQHASLSVKIVRSEVKSKDVFTDLFGNRLGERLWHLLWGIDNDMVKDSPQYPSQISVEESFANGGGLRSFDDILLQCEILLRSLLRRLEDELLLCKANEYSDTLRSWQRYPAQIRLTIRPLSDSKSNARDNNNSTRSRSCATPSFMFNTMLSIEEQAKELSKKVLHRLIRTIWSDGYIVYAVNIGATHLSKEKPATSVLSLFSTVAANEQVNDSADNNIIYLDDVENDTETGNAAAHLDVEDIDINILNELPKEIRNSIAREYGLGNGRKGSLPSSSRHAKRKNNKLEDFWGPRKK